MIWTITTNGKKVLVDADPIDSDGFVLIEQSDGSVLAVHHKKAKEYGASGEEEHYQFHFASCPNADKHRRRAGTAWMTTLFVGVMMMCLVGLGMVLGGEIVRGSTVSESEVASAYRTLAVCIVSLEESDAAMDSVHEWTHSRTKASTPPTIVEVAPET